MQRTLVSAEPNNYRPRLSPALMAQSSKVKQVRMRNPERIREADDLVKDLQTNTFTERIYSSHKEPWGTEYREHIFSMSSHMESMRIFSKEDFIFCYSHQLEERLDIFPHTKLSYVFITLMHSFNAFIVLFEALSAPVLIHIHSSMTKSSVNTPLNIFFCDLQNIGRQ